MSTTPNAETTSEDAAFLRQFLAGRNVECPLCGYNLRDLIGDRCPECGDQLILRVNTAEPRLAAPITGLIGLASGTGFSVFVVIVQLIISLLHPGSRVFEPPFVCCMVSGAVGSVGMFIWLRKWRWLRRQAKKRQWWLAGLCWVFPAATLVCLVALVP